MCSTGINGFSLFTYHELNVVQCLSSMAIDERFTITEIETALDVVGVTEKGQVIEELGRVASLRQQLNLETCPAIYQHIDSALTEYTRFQNGELDGEVLHWQLDEMLEHLADLDNSERDGFTSLAAEATFAYVLRGIAWWNFENWDGPSGIEETAIKAGVDMQKMWQACDDYLELEYPGTSFPSERPYKYTEALKDNFFEPFFESLRAEQTSMRA